MAETHLERLFSVHHNLYFDKAWSFESTGFLSCRRNLTIMSYPYVLSAKYYRTLPIYWNKRTVLSPPPILAPDLTNPYSIYIKLLVPIHPDKAFSTKYRAYSLHVGRMRKALGWVLKLREKLITHEDPGPSETS